MPIIDADGLFGGDRFDMMTDEARLYWPYFWCASNTVGRIELNYLKVIAKAFSRFKKPPSEEKFKSLVVQYRDAYLLYLYEYNGQVWGQWDTSEKFLPRHKLSADERTPAPAEDGFSEWKRRYIEGKSSKSINVSVFVNPSEGFRKDCGNIPEEFRTNVRGGGVGIGGGIGGGEGKLYVSAGAPTKSQTTAKGSRFDLIDVPEEWASFAAKKYSWTEVFIKDLFQTFRDHWISKSGKDAVKLDWFAAWRTWCANELKWNGGERKGQPADKAAYKSSYPTLPIFRPEEGDSQ